MSRAGFPFSAVVGQDEAKLALLLAAVDPGLGGVLLRGEKGSAKTTLARGLAALLPGRAPFVELPLGATEDRVVGSIDVAALLTGDGARFRPGLLADAHGGVLYVDEVNLLADHLVDVLLDVAASGVNRVEREGMAHVHPARFVLVGSMNPEEGDLRPQLLDRFGLCVTVAAPAEPALRAAAVRRRLAHDGVGDVGALASVDDVALAARLATARPAALPDDVVELASSLAVAVGAEGLRADLGLCRASAALAGWEGRAVAGPDDLRTVAPLVLAHRRRRGPFDQPTLEREEVDKALDELTADPPGGGEGGDQEPAPPAEASPVPPLASHRTARATDGRRSPAAGRGRLVGVEPVAAGAVVDDVAVAATALATVERLGGPGSVAPADLRQARRVGKAGNLLIFVVDTSGSMGTAARVEAAKGAVLGLLADAYQRRDRVALISVRGERADLVLRPTASGEIARTRLVDLPTGGATPLADGLLAALRLATAPGGDLARRPLLVVVTDGRATHAADGGDPLAAALRAAAEIGRQRLDAVVVDAEVERARLGLAAELAAAMGADCLRLDELTGAQLEAAVRHVVEGTTPCS